MATIRKTEGKFVPVKKNVFFSWQGLQKKPKYVLPKSKSLSFPSNFVLRQFGFLLQKLTKQVVHLLRDEDENTKVKTDNL
jgi:hypothetical protein